MLVMIVDEGAEELPGIAVAADEHSLSALPALNGLAVLEQVSQACRRPSVETLATWGKTWNSGKSSAASTPIRRSESEAKRPVYSAIFLSSSATSPNVKKLVLPMLSAYSRMALPKIRAKGRSTCFSASTRKPSSRTWRSGTGRRGSASFGR